MERENKIKKPYFLVLMWLLLACISIGGVTFAWFNFRSSTNVEPNTGSAISKGDASLLISNNPNGPFEKTVNLILASNAEVLTPVSTNSLDTFYASAAQNTDGITILYSDVTGGINSCTMWGNLYLKAEGGDLDVYFMKPLLNFGSNAQAVAALRLGLKITAGGTDTTYIFKLDDMMDVSGAKRQVTITSPGSVVASISQGAANFVSDPAKKINDYSAVADGPEDTDPRAGANALFTLTDGQVAKVEYWLYLEGCDENCINEVQSKDVALSLAFAGVTR